MKYFLFIQHKSLKKYYKDDKEKMLILGDKTKKMLNEL
ncbi:uncharacterized protein LMUH8_0386 [Listeria monocytogenes]|nr:hypothetical protein AX10_10460 [Listeria monocytogenes WSLC1001]EAL05973.1 hypothetical protein LMOf6854_0416 [Listeria monocytogenes str. 1/2a F6854] [Listeria monocytogenes serotype 1/2a str. F6854]EUJ18804.1 hypothetical protein G161_10826 [Listeria monocytogenes FSL F6-684]EXL18765.1 hypothetical protein X843_0053 [Listeria monocytogenes Lm_1840]EXL22021.1 hypothetical protein X842_2335 [Listeria monocytogenes Lm_1880]KHK15534.1 hypothetical protein I613_04202 [Listeria monocytogenes S